MGIEAERRKDFHERPSAVDDHARKVSIRLAFGDFRFGVQPWGQELQLACVDVAVLKLWCPGRRRGFAGWRL